MKSRPLFSVVIPAHRLDKYLDGAIKSIIEQSFSSFELLVIANGSQRKKIIEHIQNNYLGKVIAIEVEITGASFSRNIGIENSRGEYIVLMDSDDVSVLDRLARIDDEIKKNPEIDVIGTGYQKINLNGIVLGEPIAFNYDDSLIRNVLPIKNCIGNPTVAIRKKVLTKNSSFSYGSYAEDYDLWVRLMRDKSVKFKLIDDVLVYYRIHGDQASNINNLKITFSNVFAIRLREFLITGNIRFLLGCAVAFAEYIKNVFYFKVKKILIRLGVWNLG